MLKAGIDLSGVIESMDGLVVSLQRTAGIKSKLILVVDDEKSVSAVVFNGGIRQDDPVEALRVAKEAIRQVGVFFGRKMIGRVRTAIEQAVIHLDSRTSAAIIQSFIKHPR